jgi:putative endonuclease
MKQSQKKGEKNKIGGYGEEIACSYLKSKGHVILETNFLKKWGEIDIVSRETINNKENIHFVEVKTVSYETKEYLQKAVSYRTWRPEDNVHFKKIQRMNRTIESWLMVNKSTAEWQIDVITVRIVPREKYATVKYIPNIILD